MTRREFIHSITAAGGLGLVLRGHGQNPEKAFRSTRRSLLSEQGCGRATGYAEAPKIVTLRNRTHVAWLDSPPEGFRARVRTLDRRSGEWSETYTLGEAHDNHGGPAITIDSQGFLHVVYGPHHHPFRYRRSKGPNDASAWETEVEFGERCTYPTLVCGSDDTLYLTCRRSFSDRPWQVELWTKPPGKPWSGPVTVAKARYPGYAHFQESLSWGPEHRRIHLCCRFHEKTDDQAYGRLQTVGYMRSDDSGKTWHRLDGTRIEAPATAETVDVLASGGVDVGRVLRAGAMAVNAQGIPHVVYSVQEEGRGRSFLAKPSDNGTWTHTELNRHLPKEWVDWNLVMPGGLAFNDSGQLFVAATVQDPKKEEQGWGHPSSEVVELAPANGQRELSFRRVSRADPERAHWLPNIERHTGHNEVPDRPGLIYTSGPSGEENTELLSNKVYWVG